MVPFISNAITWFMSKDQDIEENEIQLEEDDDDFED